MAAFIPIQDIFNNSYTFFFSWHVVLKKITEAKTSTNELLTHSLCLIVFPIPPMGR